MKHRLFVLAVVVLLLALAACGNQPASDGTGTTFNLSALQAGLRAGGITVAAGDEIEQPFFSVKGQGLVVNGADVQVFEYPSEAEAKADAAQVAPDGGSVGTSMMMWLAAPHFYQRDRLIVLYVGEDQAILRALEGVLGPAFAERAAEGASQSLADYEGLLAALQTAGAQAEASSEQLQPEFFAVPARVLQLNGQPIQVFEYADGAAASADAGLVSATGSAIGTTMVTWLATPHFYQADRLIVLYVGEDQGTLSLLETMLGAPFTPRAES